LGASPTRWPTDTLYAVQPDPLCVLQVAAASFLAGHLEYGHAWLSKARDLNDQDMRMHDSEMLTAFLAALEAPSG